MASVIFTLSNPDGREKEKVRHKACSERTTFSLKKKKRSLKKLGFIMKKPPKVLCVPYYRSFEGSWQKEVVKGQRATGDFFKATGMLVGV